MYYVLWLFISSSQIVLPMPLVHLQILISFQLLDCYMEAYQHVFDSKERAELSQIMYSVMKQRPRFDFEADYFLQTYRLESICLRMQASLVKGVMDTQVSYTSW